MTNQKLTREEQGKLNRQLFEAIKNNDLSAVKATVEAGADVNTKTNYGNSMLHTAINKNIKIIEYLLEAGADPDIQNNYGKTVLHNVTCYESVNKAELLLKYNANMYIKNNEGRTPFDISLLFGSHNLAELFISNGYVPSEEDMQKIKNHRLIKAIEENNLPAVKIAVEAGADINAKNDDGTPLLLNAVFKDIKVMRHLLENGMNPNMRDNYGQSFLHRFLGKENIDTVKLLLEFGADMTLKDSRGETPFDLALYWREYDIAELFVLDGYVPSDKDFDKVIDITKQEPLKTRFMELTAHVQEHKAKLTEEAETASQEFACADEVVEI